MTTRPSGLTLSQEQALAICPKISASISIPCSCFIAYEVWTQHKRKRSTAVQRALFAMSLLDILASSAWFFSTWAVPTTSGFAYAAGNRTTCNVQGFFLQLAIGAPLYNSSLALFYLLMIKMRWTDEDLIKIERCIHLFITVFTLGTSALLLPLDQYNHIGAVCWVIGEPAECGNSSFHSNPEMPCERGDYAWVYGLALFYVPLWVCVLACCLSMACLYREVRITHLKSQRYLAEIGIRQPQRKSGNDTDKVAVQAILYSLSFLVTWMPSTLWSIGHWFNFGASVVYGLSLAAAIAEPLQGLWNFLIFLRSRPRTVLRLQQTFFSWLPWMRSKLEQRSSSFITRSVLFWTTNTTTLKASNLHEASGDCMGSMVLTSHKYTAADHSILGIPPLDEEATSTEDITSTSHHHRPPQHQADPSPFGSSSRYLYDSSPSYSPSKMVMMDPSSEFFVVVSDQHNSSPEQALTSTSVATLDTHWHSSQQQGLVLGGVSSRSVATVLASNQTSNQQPSTRTILESKLDWEDTPDGGRIYDC